jgi:hypothetical protein
VHAAKLPFEEPAPEDESTRGGTALFAPAEFIKYNFGKKYFVVSASAGLQNSISLNIIDREWFNHYSDNLKRYDMFVIIAYVMSSRKSGR